MDTRNWEERLISLLPNNLKGDEISKIVDRVWDNAMKAFEENPDEHLSRLMFYMSDNELKDLAKPE